MFKSFFSKFTPTVRAEENAAPAEEELVDPLDTLREECKARPHIQHLVKKLAECNERVSSRTKTEETCLEEVMDVMHELDHCVNERLFSLLK